MSQTQQLPKRNFLTLVDVFVSAGAGVVIFAAWAKLTHQSYADTMLTVGMWTETVIFLIYAVIEWVRPHDHQAAHAHAVAAPSVTGKESPLDAMNKMMEDAEINSVNMKKLGENFQRLDTTVSQLGEVGDVVRNTSEFTSKTKEANTALGLMKDAFINSANAMSSFNSAADEARGFKEQVELLAKNMGSLNSIYELELNESNNHLKAMNAFYGKVAKASEVMANTVEDAQKTKEQINALAGNLGKLNQVYGNMLSAMQGRQ
ncbi:MAG: gliding motility protein GldL [Chitinophagaceae bacterium]|nr:gliding motility protein GldL [Chitinophagaceae bacterium]